MTNNKIFSALREKPELMAALLAAKKAIPERGAAETEQDKFIRSLLGNAASKEEVSSAADDIDRNPVMQLFLQSDGLLDPKELMDYVGDFSGDKANPNQNAAVKALFDGKLSIKEILLLIALFKLFKGKTQQTTTQSSGNSLLNTLLGGGQTQTTSGNSLFGLAQPQQTQQSQQTQSLNNILNSLLGGQTQTTSGNSLFGIGQPQQQTQPSYSLFGNLFSSALGGQQTQTTSSGSSLFGLAQPQQQTQSQNISSVLNSLLTGNTGNNSQAQQIYSLLNNSSSSAVNSNGTVNVSQLFNIASQLLGK